jgi:hypothetical protein
MNKDIVDAALDETFDALADEYDFDEVDFVSECVAGFLQNLDRKLQDLSPEVQTFIDDLLKLLA